MRKNFDMDAAIRRALRESIEAHAHEWEPNPDAESSEIGDGSPYNKKTCKGGYCGDMREGTIPGDAHEWEPDFPTGVGPVGDDSPFDKKVSGSMDEGTIPGDAHEWEPDFATGVGPVGDDDPFTKAVHDALDENEDWEKDSFGAEDHKKEGIAYADGGKECGNGVVATGQKNSGKVVSKDNLSEEFDSFDEGIVRESEDEEEDESTLGQFIKNGWNSLKDKWQVARDQNMANKGYVRADSLGAGAGNNGGGAGQGGAQPDAQGATPQQQANPSEKLIGALLRTMAANGQGDKAMQVLDKFQLRYQYGKYLKPPKQNKQQQTGAEQPTTAATPTAAATTEAPAAAATTEAPAAAAPVKKSRAKKPAATGNAAATGLEESVIKEERDRFFDIINRVEKLYD